MKRTFNAIRDVEDFLFSIPKFSTAGASAAYFGLENIKRFCEKLGNPQNTFPSLHVAGTNGKGTVCRMLASVYESAGYKVGLYTSPHLLELNDRFKINSKVITDELLVEFFRQYGNLIDQDKLTFFEITTAIAFWYFSTQKVDIAIIETGLGGRLDATNIVDSELSIITSISMDHTDVLGNSIGEIAREKAGIIKPRKTVITGILQKEAQGVIEKIAKSKKSPLIIAESWNSTINNDILTVVMGQNIVQLRFKDRKRVDAQNASIVYEAVKAANKDFPVKNKDLIQGLELTDKRFPFHAQFERLKPHLNCFFDGAHNRESTEILTGHLLQKAPVQDWIVVLSFMKDKLNHEIAALWNQFPTIVLYQMDSKRAADYTEMINYFPNAVQFEDYFPDQKEIKNQLESELVIFSGSFYFYETIKRWMGTIAIHVD